MTIRAVLFDLDDTLFDHRYCARTALRAIHRGHACFARRSFEEFQGRHAEILEEVHRRVLSGELTTDDARRERFRRLFGEAGAAPGEALLEATIAAYRADYLAARRATAGAAELLPLVRRRARIGIVSNNVLSEQEEKLRALGLAPLVDALVVSGEVGLAKPDPGIFTVALERLGCGPAEAVMVGDSFRADVAGARAAGIRPIWYNPLGAAPPEHEPGVVELRALAPPHAALAAIFSEGGGA